MATANSVTNPMRARLDGSVAASLQSVTKKYGSITALAGVNLEIRRGEVLALLGPNGAGKTTAVKMLLGIARPDKGAAKVFGCDPTNPENRICTGAMLQVAKVPETLRVGEHLDLFSSYYCNPAPMAETISASGLEGLEARPFGELSGGQRQRVLFALAICGNPDLIFLDEPTVGLDIESRRMIWSEIRKMVACGKAVLLTTHYLEEADALANRIAVINRGNIVAEGTPMQIKAQTQGKRIRGVTALSKTELLAIPGVLTVQLNGKSFELQTTATDAVVRELLARDPELSDLEVIAAGLDEAFLALTHDTSNRAEKESR